MNIAARFNTMSSITVALGVACYAIAEQTLLLPVVAIVIILWAWQRARTDDAGRPPAVSRLIVNLLVLTAITYSFTKVFVMGRHEAIVSDLSEFLVLIQVIKLFDRRTARDDAQFVSLSLFIVIGAILTSNSLAFGLILLVYVPAATVTTMLLQLHAGLLHIDEARRDSGITGSPPLTGLRAMTAPFRRLTRAVVVSSVLLAGVLFFLIPRGIGDDAFGSFGKAPGANAVGFSDEVRLGRAGFLSESPKPVLTVELFNADHVPLGSSDRTIYLRGTAQDQYDENTGVWRRSADDQDEDINQYTGSQWQRLIQAAPDLSLAVEQRIRLLYPNPRGGYLFTQWRPTEIKVLRSDYDMTQVRATTKDDLVRQYRNIDPGPLAYLVRSIPSYIPGPVRFESPECGFRSGPIRDLAERLIDDAGLVFEAEGRTPADSRAIISLFTRHLRATCGYTLEMESPPAGREPIEWFLLDRRLGHCEYFASAMVALCQAAHIPSRVVSGYVATEYDRSAARYLVRQSNAHAWVEASLEPGRWDTFDPTPPADLDRIHRASPGIFGSIRRAWERLEFRWTTSIISFDEQRRKSLFTKAFGENSGRFARLRKAMEQRANRILRKLRLRGVPNGLLGWLFSMGLLIAVLLIIIATARAGLGLWIRSRSPTDGDDPELRELRAQLRFFQLAQAALDRAGLPCPSWCPPASFVDRIRTRDDGLASTFESLTDLYYKVRFGRTPLTPVELASADALLAELERRAAELDGR